MITKYLIEEQTLTDIADSIREMESSDDAILVEDYADRIKGIDLLLYEYLLLDMQIQNELLYFSELHYSQSDLIQLNDYVNRYMKEVNDIW